MSSAKKFITGLAAVFRNTTVAWHKNDAPQRAASVAYFGAFTLAPLLIVVTAIFGQMMSQELMRETLLDEIRNFAGEQAATLVERVLNNMAEGHRSLWGVVLGLAVSAFAATTLFAQLQHQMNRMWGVAPRPGKGLIKFLRTRLVSFIYILFIGVLLLASLIIDTTLGAFRDSISDWLPIKISLVYWGNIILWFVISILVFASMFKYMPDIRIRWRDVFPAAAVTAIMFCAGQQLVGLYLAKSAAVTAYGAAGSLAIILFWLYYTCLVFLYGVQFCRSYIEYRDREVVVKSYAVRE